VDYNKLRIAPWRGVGEANTLVFHRAFPRAAMYHFGESSRLYRMLESSTALSIQVLC
jgi:hypothetical protein